MKRREIFTLPENIPADLRRFCEGARLYDSSCSPEARVIFIDRDGGYFLKSSAGGSLKKESELAGYFHTKGLTAPVISYVSESDRDWLLTARVAGEDATHATYLSEPRRLAVKMGEILRTLHEMPHSDCPVQDRMTAYFTRPGGCPSALEGTGPASSLEAPALPVSAQAGLPRGLGG